ncbi:coiled-coil domain-containing protein 173 [Notolabrus celidotus]|uniref:coiled-coil domain-containing protein 173 n=1 Tax=Notolabrus celidotus TaxID=1203425 RepID=UPI00148FCBF9|nr:coiled-coil domain-containing protein 173 [Notolabrus celidotus]
MASVVQHGRRRGSSRRVVSADDANRMTQPPDLQQITVLSKAEWRRIQDELNQVNKDNESMKEEERQREKLHMQSKEMVKTWSSTIAGQRQKKLQAKKIREQIEEEKRMQIDKEEAEYRKQKKKEAIEKAKTQLYYQTDRVKGLHSALLLTEVLKERDAQVELKQRIQNASKDVDRKFTDIVKIREDEALRKEEEKALEKKLERQAVVHDLKTQIKDKKQLKEQHKIENKKDGEDTQRLQELYQLDQRMEEERLERQKRDLMHTHLEHITNRNLIRAAEAQKQEAEEQQRKLFLTAKQKMLKLRTDREKQLFNEAQACKESIMDKLTIQQQELTDSEDTRIAKAVAEQEAKQARQQQEEWEKKAKMLESIAVHRELMIKEKEQRERMAEKITKERFQAIKESDTIFSEKQKLKAQKIKDDGRKLKDFNAAQMAEKLSRGQRLRRDEYEFEAKNAELVAEEEIQFQQYSQQVINAASEAQRNVVPLFKAAREGYGGGLGPVYGGVRPSYLVQDGTGAQMPKYVSGVTQDMKKLHEAADIEEAKKRLGFTW